MKCERCLKEFRYASELARHLSRKTICEAVEVEEIKYEKCKYCHKKLSSIQSKKRHEETCKYKDDYVRNLEIELEIGEIEYSNTKCRFCEKDMRADHLFRHESACKEKEIYKEKLIKLKGHKGTTINNTINNNTYNDNKTINDNRTIVYWKDINVNLDVSHMNEEMIFDIYRECLESEGIPLEISYKIIQKTKSYKRQDKTTTRQDNGDKDREDKDKTRR